MTALDPFEGLPAHMIESIPLTVEVTVEHPGQMAETMMDGERKIMLDGRPVAPRVAAHHAQLERDGVPLTMSDRRGWYAGEREGWREWPGPKWEPPVGTPAWDIIDIDAEECDE